MNRGTFSPSCPFTPSCFWESVRFPNSVFESAFCLSVFCFNFVFIYLKWKDRTGSHLSSGICGSIPEEILFAKCEHCIDVWRIHQHRRATPDPWGLKAEGGMSQSQNIPLAMCCAGWPLVSCEEPAFTSGDCQSEDIENFFIGICQMTWFLSEGVH